MPDARWHAAIAMQPVLDRTYKPPKDLDFEPLPVSSPRTGLLKFDWEWHGLIDPFETPGPLV